MLKITQHGTGTAIQIFWFTCLECGWQSMTGFKSKKAKCFCCNSSNIKWRIDDEKFFKKASDKILKEKSKPKSKLIQLIKNKLNGKPYCKS